MNLIEILQPHIDARPSLPAIIEGRRSINFAELDQAAARAAGLLWQSGLRPGDAVLLFQPMSIELYVALAAIFRLGLIAVFVDPSAGKERLERCCGLYPPRALISTTKGHLLRLTSPALRSIPIKFVTGPWAPRAIPWRRADGAAPHGIIACEPNTPALMTFTSGSTGLPRSAVRTHGFLLAQHDALKSTLQCNPGDVDLTTMPIVLLTNLASGLTSVIATGDLRRPGAIDPAPVLQQIHEHKVASTVASPSFMEVIANHASEKSMAMPSLRKIFVGGGPVLPRLLEKLSRVAPNAKLVAVYGSTEAEPIARVRYDEIDLADRDAMLAGRGLLAGTPVEHITVRILRDRWSAESSGVIVPMTKAEFSAACLASNEAGEIVVRGPHVLTGYLHGQGDDETKFRVDGAVWHRTGDAGYFDSSGRLWLLGRCAARIEDRHGVLYPLAAETTLVHDARIRRAVLVAKNGRRILVLEFADRRNPPDAAFLEEVRQRFHIDETRTVACIPVDSRHNAKIDYPRLLKMLDP